MAPKNPSNKGVKHQNWATERKQQAQGVSRVYWPSACGIHGLCWLSRGERSHCFLWLTSAEMQESSCKQNQHNQAMGSKAGHPGRPTTQAALQGGPFSWAVRA